MVRNLGPRQRILFLIAGAVILGLFGALAAPWRYLTLVGLIPLGTALTGRCPIHPAIDRRRQAS